jgi:hypothetical protein
MGLKIGELAKRAEVNLQLSANMDERNFCRSFRASVLVTVHRFIQLKR